MRMPSSDNRALAEVLQVCPLACILRRHPLAAPQPRSLGRRQGQRRHVIQRGLDRKQIPRINQTMPTLRYGSQRNRLRFGERSDRKPTQLGDVANRSECHSEIAGKCPYVRALADDCLAIGVVLIGHRDQPEHGDMHGTVWQSGRCGSPGEGIGAPSVYLDGRIDRRLLQNSAGEAGQHGLDFVAARSPRRVADDGAFAIVGGPSNAPADTEPIVLAAAHRVSDSLGRLAERQRQNTGCQRVERAGVSDFGSGQPTDQFDDPIGAEPLRLVDH